MPKKKPDILPVDRETWKKMHYDALYYVPNKPYDEYDFLKILSMKKEKFHQKKEVKDEPE